MKLAIRDFVIHKVKAILVDGVETRCNQTLPTRGTKVVDRKYLPGIVEGIICPECFNGENQRKEQK